MCTCNCGVVPICTSGRAVFACFQDSVVSQLLFKKQSSPSVFLFEIFTRRKCKRSYSETVWLTCVSLTSVIKHEYHWHCGWIFFFKKINWTVFAFHWVVGYLSACTLKWTPVFYLSQFYPFRAHASANHSPTSQPFRACWKSTEYVAYVAGYLLRSSGYPGYPHFSQDHCYHLSHISQPLNDPRRPKIFHPTKSILFANDLRQQSAKLH